MSYSWKNVLITPQSTILDALKIINEEALRVALVVDESDRLLGVVTDGDIRRGLLNNLQLTEQITLVMNKSPKTACVTMAKADVIATMERLNILSLPVLDNGKVVGLHTLHQALATPRYDNPVFLMAGGFGTRLRPLTDNCPKPMLKVGDKPILETLLLSFINAGFHQFYISTHYMPEVIQNYFGDGSRYGVNIEYVYEDTPLGTGGALGLLPQTLSSDLPLLMMNGDVLTKVDFQRLLEFHNQNNADATMCVREYDYQIPYGVINGEGNQITSIEEKPIQRFFVNAGIYVLSPKVFKSINEGENIDMPTLFDNLIQDSKKALMFPIHEYWLDIGRMDDFRKAQTDIIGLGV